MVLVVESTTILALAPEKDKLPVFRVLFPNEPGIIFEEVLLVTVTKQQAWVLITLGLELVSGILAIQPSTLLAQFRLL